MIQQNNKHKGKKERVKKRWEKPEMIILNQGNTAGGGTPGVAENTYYNIS